MLKVWFIDSNENFISSMKSILKISDMKNCGIFNEKTSICFFDAEIDGTNIIEKIKSSHVAISIPDIIFLDLCYPVDKRNAINTGEHSSVDSKGLSGVKILEALKNNTLYSSCFPIVFNEVNLSEIEKKQIEINLNYQDRKVAFIKKFPTFKDVSINSIGDFVITKNCDALKTILTILNSAYCEEGFTNRYPLICKTCNKGNVAQDTGICNYVMCRATNKPTI